jgi:MFS family permease
LGSFGFGGLRPVAVITEDERARGLRTVFLDGVFSQVMGTLTGGAFLVAFVLALGGSNMVVAMLAAAGPLTQLLQIPAVFLIERLRYRKAVVVGFSLAARLLWLPIAALPWFAPVEWRLTLLVALVFGYFALGTISGLAFNSWMHDLIPQARLGEVYSRRLAVGTAVSAALSLAAGLLADEWSGFEPPAMIYAVYLAVGALAGLIGVSYLYRTPEPRMGAARPVRMSMLLQPLADTNFRGLLMFLGVWAFAVNLAAPFFTVYMLKRMDLSMTAVLVLSVLSQLVNVMAYRIWGRLADRFSNKAVLLESGPLVILVGLAWPLMSVTEAGWATWTLLIGIHVLSGMSTAGVNLCTGNIALKLAPHGQATAYLAVNAVISGIAATLAPLLGGLLATVLEPHALVLNLQYEGAGGEQALIGLRLHGLDYVFVLSFFVGLYALHRLLGVVELGGSGDLRVLEEVNAEARKVVRHVSSIGGLRDFFTFPYALLVPIRKRREANRLARKQRRARRTPSSAPPAD